VAKVNDYQITRTQLDMVVKSMAQRNMKFQKNAETPLISGKLEEEALNNIIDNELLYMKSLENKIDDIDDQVLKILDKIKKQYKTEEELNDILAKDNLTIDMLKSNIKKSISIRNFIEKDVASKITVTDEDGKRFYKENIDRFKKPEQIKASHILVKVEKGASEEVKKEALKKIKEIQERIKGGEDFAKIAKESSDCPSSSKGGDLGFFSKGRMAPPFEKAAYALKVGEISDIVETQFGYHIIKCTDKNSAGVTPYEKIAEEIKRRLRNPKIQEQMISLIADLRKNANIEILLK
ncbi:MAG: peptidylprolyl isomerase, partial [Candidatus Scalindua sp.]